MKTLLRRLFPETLTSIVREELANALEPEAGWFWRDDEMGGRFAQETYRHGYSDGYATGIASGYKLRDGGYDVEDDHYCITTSTTLPPVVATSWPTPTNARSAEAVGETTDVVGEGPIGC